MLRVFRAVNRPLFTRGFHTQALWHRKPFESIPSPYGGKNDPTEKRIEILGQHLGRQLEPGQPLDLSKDELVSVLACEDTEVIESLHSYANSVTQKFLGDRVYFRGIVEFSNVCVNNCDYCGIRRSCDVNRYTMSKEEIMECAQYALNNGYGSLMLQSGDMPTQKRLDFMVDLITSIKTLRPQSDEVITNEARSAFSRAAGEEGRAGIVQEEGLGVALSMGELPFEHYEALKKAGAHRYLIRIETSDPELFATMHPKGQKWSDRYNALKMLQKLEFQVGTGVMIGFPGQTVEHLANDLRFFKEMDVDMIGMGPYLFQENTPMGERWLKENPNVDQKELFARLFDVATRMTSLARILLPDINIAATTALQAINPVGREITLNRGANMLMPILTPTKYRTDYQLYEGKPCIDEGASDCRNCLETRVKWANKKLVLNEWGDPLRFYKRQAEK